MIRFLLGANEDSKSRFQVLRQHCDGDAVLAEEVLTDDAVVIGWGSLDIAAWQDTDCDRVRTAVVGTPKFSRRASYPTEEVIARSDAGDAFFRRVCESLHLGAGDVLFQVLPERASAAQRRDEVETNWVPVYAPDGRIRDWGVEYRCHPAATPLQDRLALESRDRQCGRCGEHLPTPLLGDPGMQGICRACRVALAPVAPGDLALLQQRRAEAQETRAFWAAVFAQEARTPEARAQGA